MIFFYILAACTVLWALGALALYTMLMREYRNAQRLTEKAEQEYRQAAEENRKWLEARFFTYTHAHRN